MQTKCHLSVLLQRQAEKYGDRRMMRYRPFGDKQWHSQSWRTAAEMADIVAAALLELGVQVQEKIGVFAQNCAEYIYCDFGAWGVRAATIPFYATSSEQQIQYMINDARVRFVFVGEQEQYDKAHRVCAQCPTLERIIIFDRTVRISTHDPHALYFDDFLRLGKQHPHAASMAERRTTASDDDICNILYTSGTTGDSKGVLLSHGQFQAALAANDRCVPVGEGDEILNFLPFAHIFEKAWTVLCLSEGASLIVNTYPQEVQQTMRQMHPTCMCSVPRFWEKVYHGVMEKIESSNPVQRKLFEKALAIGRRHNIDYVCQGKRPPLALHLEYELMNKTVFSLVRHELGLLHPNIFPTAGAAVNREIEEFVRSIGIGMVVGYGLTESLATVTCNHLDKPIALGGVGRPIDSIDIKISDEGEILLKGPTVTQGYFNRPRQTAAAFTPDGYFRTGDAGELRDGQLFLKDRIKDLFKTSNGKYIAPQMIETKLLVDKYIDQIAVIADERKFVSALIIPEYRLVEDYARSHGIAFDGREDLCANEQIHTMMMERIDTLQQQLAHYEQIKRFTLLPHHFSMDRGELTNTLKLKRRVIAENYKTEIDNMYEEN